jgi:hypothetical protein
VLRLHPRLEHELARSVEHARDDKLLLRRLGVGTLTDASLRGARRARIARRVGSARAANVLSRVSVGICKNLLVNQIAGKIRHLKAGVNRCFQVPAITTTAAIRLGRIRKGWVLRLLPPGAEIGETNGERSAATALSG